MRIPAKYTEVLKNLMDSEQVRPLLEKAMGTYPIYTPIHKELYGFIPSREVLNNKILNHYKYKEIGFETVARFLDELEISLNEIMPYYNQMYKSVDVMNGIDDIFGNLDVVESFEQRSEGTTTDSSESSATSNTSSTANSNSTTTSESESNSKNISSQTPQGNINVTDIDNVTHADQVSWSKSNSNDSATNIGTDTTTSESEQSSSGESTQNSTGLTTHTLTRKGNQGVNTYAHDMLEFRELFVNIEKQIIEDERISELFMRVY